MKFSNVRLLVKDFAKCFRFYTEQLGLEPAWGDENSGYANFKVADGIEGFALFVSDWMAPSVGNTDKQQPVAMREKSMISFSVDNVDDTFASLKAKGVTFISEPTDMPDWAFDRNLSTRMGGHATELIATEQFGRMITLKGDEISSAPLEEIAGKLKLVTEDNDLVVQGRRMGICFG